MTITTLRPSATSSGVGWSAQPSGTLHGVTSDDSDSTWAQWSGDGSALILTTPIDSPPAGERRHLVRLRARGEDGAAWWAVRLASGSLVAGAAASFGSSPETIVGSWGSGAPPDGSTVMSCYVTGQSTGVKITELYLDVDSRLAPNFTPQVLDGSGTATTTINDTNTPIVRVSALNLDGLPARQYRYWVTLNGATVWDTGVVSGAPVNRQTVPLDNGTYVAHLMVWSTLGANTAYASTEKTLTFTVTVGALPIPNAPTVTPEEPFYRVEVCAPNVSDFDGEQTWIEVQRVDCPHGGYLALPGGNPAHASAPDPIDTVLYDFTTDAEGWVGEGAATVQRVASPSQDGNGALEASETFGAGFSEVRFNDASPERDLSAGGPTLGAWVLIPADAPGSGWQARLEVQNTSFVWVPGPNFNPVPGVWTFITFTPDPALLADCRSIGFAIGANGVNQDQAVYVDRVIQGTLPFTDPPTDLEVTVRAARDDDWRPSADETLVAKYLTAGDQRSWRVSLDADGNGDPALIGRPFLVWTTDGTLGTAITAGATERAPISPTGEVTLRVLLDSDNGEGGWTVTFETLDEEGNWVQLGEQITGAGTTSIYSSSEPLQVGSYNNGGSERFRGRVYSVQIRDGRDGPILANPDFTNHPAGTDTFTDSTGRTWTVHAPATITSAQSATSLAILGPLGTGECAEFVDYSLPRAGVGRSCDHQPEECCSYYRARTVGQVDGALLVSDWSDAWNPGLPEGLVVAWPSTEASIPAGWSRVTDLDGKYLKGIPDASTQPGGTGGAASHTHTVPSHTHDISHSHTSPTPTAAATGAVNSDDGNPGTSAIAASHTHTRPSTNSATVSSGATAPPTTSASNDLARLHVLWIEANGSPLGLPSGALAFMLDTSVSGWDDYANAADRFLKGSAAGADGGGTAASDIAAHVHGINAHTHTGTAHTHTSPNTGSVNSNLSLFSGPNAVIWQSSHSHVINIASSTTAALNSGGGGNSGATDAPEPPHRRLRVRQNTLGFPNLPVGTIAAWRGSLGSIPDHWQLCDGTNGTPDMFGRYPKGATSAIGDAGGSLDAHSHTTPNHSHTTSGHAHSASTNPVGSGANTSSTATISVATAAHTHALSNVNSTTPTVGGSTSGTMSATTTEPPYEEVAFIQLIEEWQPPEPAETFCLEWNSDEHLIRTRGPAGPMYAPVKGRFEWAVTRPFTASTGVNGSRFVTSAPPGGRNLTMTAAVESEAELAQLRAVLARPLVLISPSDASEVWAAPVQESVRIVKVGRIRQVTASFIATGPEPPPQLADVGA